jgi:uncharacterized repeat protein (TIGR01451 family)
MLLTAAALLAARTASAMTAEGALLTNIASASYRLTTGAGQTISYSVTSWVRVATPMIQLRKTATPTIQTSGGTVTFCITIRNSSTLTTAINVVVQDALPDNMRFVSSTWNWEDIAPGSSMWTAWSTNGGTSWTSGATTGGTGAYPPNGQAGPLLLRWVTNALGPGQSSLVCFTATVL